MDIVAIAILAVISGADSWVAIETYARSKREWLETFLLLPNGIPSHDTIARVFARLEPQAFEQCFHRWIESITEAIGAQVIPIDGKTVRQSFDLKKAVPMKQVSLGLPSALCLSSVSGDKKQFMSSALGQVNIGWF